MGQQILDGAVQSDVRARGTMRTYCGADRQRVVDFVQLVDDGEARRERERE